MIIFKFSELNIVSGEIRMFLYGLKEKTQKNRGIRVFEARFGMMIGDFR